MAHFWVRGSEGFFAAFTVGGSAEIFFLLLSKRHHVYLFAENIAYDLAFLHYVIVEFRHGSGPLYTFGTVLRVLRHSIHTEAGHLVFVAIVHGSEKDKNAYSLQREFCSLVTSLTLEVQCKRDETETALHRHNYRK